MGKAELIKQIIGFDQFFFANGLGNDTRLKQMPDYILKDLALILQAASEKKDTAILPPRPQSPFDREKTTVIARIDHKGKMIQNLWGSPVFDGIIYQASGIAIREKIGIEQVEFFPSRLRSTLCQAGDKPLKIKSEASVKNYITTAEYSRDPAGELIFTEATVDFKRLSGSISHNSYINDKLLIPADGPASYRFNGNWKKAVEIPADGSKAVEIKPFPFQHQLSVNRTTDGNQILINITDAKKHSQPVLKSFDGETALSFSVLCSSAKPETPASETIQIDLPTIAEKKISHLDDIVMALLTLSPAEIFGRETI
ncbi:hypothetical protein HZB78_03945 [Candidatus Collierbacteria bacterium]|nr:hypothetical protein [Candidatus Collierbacteria bacterium]